jgi:HK97 family phage portal protein
MISRTYEINTQQVSNQPAEHRSQPWSEKDWAQYGGISWRIPTSASGVRVTPQTAISYTALFAAINTIATDIASLPLWLFQSEGDSRKRIPNDQRAEFFTRTPNGWSTSMRWRQSITGNTALRGNGYAEIETDRRGFPLKLHILPSDVCIEYDRDSREPYYRLGGEAKLPYQKVLHFAMIGCDGLTGYDPVRIFADAIGLGKSMELYAGGVYGNGSNPGGFLKHPRRLNPEAKKNLIESFEARHSGPENYGRVGILEEGLEWVTRAVSPENAQALEARAFQILEMSRIWRIPPHKLGDYSQSHLANIEAANIDYMTTVLMPWCEMEEAELNLKLLTTDEWRSGMYFEHQMQAFLRGDMRSRAEFLTKLRDLGVVNPNDIAKLENLNPIGPSGDKYLVPANLMTLEKIGENAPTSAPNQGDAIPNEPPTRKQNASTIHANGFAAH